jgi:hypothetical protein
MAEARRRWHEPTRSIRLRWGFYEERTIAGLLLIVAGGTAMAGASGVTAFSLSLLPAGAVAHLAGWCVMPSAGWRRVVVLAPSGLAMIALLGGPEFLGALVIPFIGWLLVRQRPARSYPTISFVLAGAIVLARVFDTYAEMLTALGIALAVVVASAWAARLLHSQTVA